MVRTSQKQKILSRGEKNTQKNCTKTGLNDPDNHDGLITHLEPDILECEVKWALGSITTKTSGEVQSLLCPAPRRLSSRRERGNGGCVIPLLPEFTI